MCCFPLMELFRFIPVGLWRQIPLAPEVLVWFPVGIWVRPGWKTECVWAGKEGGPTTWAWRVCDVHVWRMYGGEKGSLERSVNRDGPGGSYLGPACGEGQRSAASILSSLFILLKFNDRSGVVIPFDMAGPPLGGTGFWLRWEAHHTMNKSETKGQKRPALFRLGSRRKKRGK